MSTQPKKVFQIANCYENYSIIANRIIKMWVKKALVTAGVNLSGDVLTYYDSTPIQGWGSVGIIGPYNSAGGMIYGTTGGQYSSQYKNFIWMVSLAAVCIARIKEADMVIVVANGVTLIPSHCVLATVAQVLNKEVVFWNDDLRITWGCSNDLVTMGMTVTPYKYIWTGGAVVGGLNKGQADDSEFNVQKRMSLPGTMPTPHQGNLIQCKDEDINKKSSGWTEISAAISQIIGATEGTTGALSSRLENLAKLGAIIIKYVEKSKTSGSGWKPGVKLPDNVTLWYDLAIPILENPSLLSTKEQEFMAASTAAATPTPKQVSVQTGQPSRQLILSVTSRGAIQASTMRFTPEYMIVNQINSALAQDEMMKGLLRNY